MTTIRQLVADAGGLLHKHDLVAAGARDRHLTAAVRFDGVRRPRRGWYSTWEPSDPRFVAVSVGGRVTGAAALHLAGAWMWQRPPLTVSVPVGASRLRGRRGVTVVWDPPDVATRGTTSCVDPCDALARMVDELSFEDAVAVATWAVREGVVPRDELRDVLGARRADAADLAEWVEEACESFLEVVALVRLRTRGHEVQVQGAVGLRQRVDLVVDRTVALELDGRATHESTFVADRSKDLTILAESLVPMRLPYVLVRDAWPRVEATLELVLRQHGGCGPEADVRTVGNSSSWSVLGPRGKRPWRLRRRARRRGGVADGGGGVRRAEARGQEVRRDGAGMRGGRRRLVGDVTTTPAPADTAPHTSVKVDVWSDIACPWCFIGKRTFEEAVRRLPELSVEIEYHSFELSPDTPEDFEGDEVAFLAQHKGMPEDQVRQMLAMVTGRAADVGLAYDFDRLQHTNTVTAHRLLHLAKQHGLQLQMKERLLSAYFEEGRHVGRVADLADLAVEVGLDRDEVVATLESDAFLDAVRADQAQAQEFGITGVPFFVFDGRYGVSGAQAPETFVQVLERVRDEAGTA